MDGTATTTPSEAAPPLRRHRAPPSHRGAAVVALGLGALLLGLGAPRLLAAVQALDARAVLWDVHAGATVPPDRLASAAEGIASASRWAWDGELEGGRGLLLLTLAEQAPPGPDRERLYDEATAASEAALAAAPGQPGVWARLAWLRERRGDQAGAVAALRMSMLSGAVVPEMMAPRVEMGLRLLPAMDAETADLLRRQIRLTWVIAPDFVAGLSTRPGLGPMVRDALDSLGEQEMEHYLRLHGTRPGS